MAKAFILKSQEGKLSKPYNVLGMPVHLKVSSNDTGGQMSIFIAEYKRNEGPPLHLHDNDEAFFIIEGDSFFKRVTKGLPVLRVTQFLFHAIQPTRLLQ